MISVFACMAVTEPLVISVFACVAVTEPLVRYGSLSSSCPDSFPSAECSVG